MRHTRIWTYVDQAARLGSLRQAAERLNVTPSALQRRIQDFEDDLGFAIFERSRRGIRLTAAGETLIHWIRTQSAELERVRSLVADLEGLRRGQVRIACSQALAQAFLADEVTRFRADFPQVRFDIAVGDHRSALRMVRDYETDLALVVWPERDADFQPLMTLGQGLAVIMADDHPLAAMKTVRLRDCAAFPVALPHQGLGSRTLIDDFVASSSVRFSIELESNSFEMLRNLARQGDVVTFQVGIGAMPQGLGQGLTTRPVDDADAAHGPLVLGQRRGRTLPVAAAKFAEQLARRLDELRELPMWG